MILKEAHATDLRCLIGIHKWEDHTIVREGMVYTYNRCARGCKWWGHWFLVDAEPSLLSPGGGDTETNPGLIDP